MEHGYQFNDLTLHWLGHDAFRIEYDGNIYLDPYQLPPNTPLAKLILITHEHFDHCSIEDLQRITGPDTTIVCPHECVGKLTRVHPEGIYPLRPGETWTHKGLTIHALPAYNTNKFRTENIVYHPREDGKLGYLLQLGDTTLYHAGDTDHIPEMETINCDIALLPVSGTYVMTAEEAAAAARTIAPRVAIPMHYGSIVGSFHDAERFKRLLEGVVTVEILPRED